MTATSRLGNVGHGVFIRFGAKSNLIGTDGDGIADVAERNVISGNTVGVAIIDPDTDMNVVAGNFIGTNVMGTIALGNRQGVVIRRGARLNNIGTNGDGVNDIFEGNVISGNAWVGVEIRDLSTNQNIVAGNFIGTDVTGIVAVGNGYGVFIGGGAQFNRIGTDGDGLADSSERNVISGNVLAGVLIRLPGADHNSIAGNFIGVGANGTAALGNGLDGILIHGNSRFNRIGGDFVALANFIAFNARDGIRILDASTENLIQGNSIHSNGALGIDLGGDGVTPNDSGDVDTGPNNLQNFPELAVGSTLCARVTGTLNSLPETTFNLDFFASAEEDPSGFGEGDRHLTSTSVTTDGAGNADIDFILTEVAQGEVVTATASDPSGNTSEFSAAAEVKFRTRPGPPLRTGPP